ncbi:MAG: hypothetical protein ABR521_02720 [Gaiellaceae bacterium]
MSELADELERQTREVERLEGALAVLAERAGDVDAPALAAENATLAERAAAAEQEKVGLLDKNRELRATLAAVRARAVDPEVVALLIDWRSIRNPDDEDELDGAVAEVLRRKSYLRHGGRREGADGGAGRSRGDVPPRLPTTLRQEAREHLVEGYGR